MTTTANLSERIANLSPEQRELLMQKLKQKVGIVYRPGSSSENASSAIDLPKEAELDPSIQPLAVPGEFITHPDTIFLTGGTGFLGAFIIAELMQRTQAVIHCLVRAKDPAEGQRRLQKNLESYGIWKPEFSGRIVPVLGDLASPRFGLSEAQFEQLAYDIDVIYHCAASLNFVFPYQALKPMNVTATEDVIRLASLVKRKTVHYMSSVSVFESHAYAGKVVSEADLLDHHEGMFLGYAQTKWVAEKMMLNARERGLPVCIYRLPFISGDSRTGAWNTKDFTCLVVKGCTEMGCAPVLDYWVNICPVDYASQAITYLAQQPQSENQIFHLMNPNPVTSTETTAWDERLGSFVERLPYKEWQARLAQQATTPDHPLFSLRSFFLEPFSEEGLTIPELYTRDKTPIFDCTATLDALKGSGIACHPVNPVLSATYLDYFLHQQMLDAKTYGLIPIAKLRMFLAWQRAIATLRRGFDFEEWKRINIAAEATATST
ncbi:MAG: thioester reductase domain-containing protein [Elainella sp. C42_A2020_010]|nr:thioester reductase domain-containing protein [Elainella sp. C42_A2020_010]